VSTGLKYFERSPLNRSANKNSILLHSAAWVRAQLISTNFHRQLVSWKELKSPEK